MSYVTLHATYPQPTPALGTPLDDYHACLAANASTKGAYEASVKEWQRRKDAYDAYQDALKEWQREAKNRGALAAQRDARYASAMTSYKANLKKWADAVRAYVAALEYNKSISDSDGSQRARTEQNWGIKFPSDARCLDPAQRAKVNQLCEIASIKGVGLGYTFDLNAYPACALKELHDCRPLMTANPPGVRPSAPRAPDPLPPMPAKPPPAPDPGSKPRAPTLITCKEPHSAGGVTTFGLLAVLAVGGGIVGYRQWKKRKKA